MWWFKKKIIEAKLPEPRSDPYELLTYPTGVGVLDPHSSTWLFVRSWAQERLDKTRVKNDSANADIIQTSVMRGEIKVLKELINLPNPKPGKGLLVED